MWKYQSLPWKGWVGVGLELFIFKGVMRITWNGVQGRVGTAGAVTGASVLGFILWGKENWVDQPVWGQKQSSAGCSGEGEAARGCFLELQHWEVGGLCIPAFGVRAAPSQGSTNISHSHVDDKRVYGGMGLVKSRNWHHSHSGGSAPWATQGGAEAVLVKERRTPRSWGPCSDPQQGEKRLEKSSAWGWQLPQGSFSPQQRPWTTSGPVGGLLWTCSTSSMSVLG